MGAILDHGLTKECNWHGSKGVLVFRQSDLTFRQSKCFDFGLEWRLLEPPAFFDVRWSEVLRSPPLGGLSFFVVLLSVMAG
jgi:hypothetical protein